ncbi:MAG: PD40 domain-containing protein, partial [Bacteroidales bacterium]|nr:PD40 domain-containing protein [Bacteroidales bacterium]
VGNPLVGHTDYVTSASFSPDGRYIVSASVDRTVRIWDAKTGQQVGNPLEGHTAYVNSASFSPDGRYIVSASYDKTVRIWDAKTGHQVQTLNCKDPITAIFSPDGRHIMSVDIYGTIKIWDFPPLQELIDSTRERFKDRELTTEERKKYYLD